MHGWTIDANNLLSSLLSLAELVELLVSCRIIAVATGASPSSKLGLERGHSKRKRVPDKEGFASVILDLHFSRRRYTTVVAGASSP